MFVADGPSQALLNAQKELEKRRRLAGVCYRPPQAASSERPQSGWLPLRPEVCQPPVEKSPDCTAPSPLQVKVRVAPTMAAYCLDKDHCYKGYALDGPYRLYKILQTLDGEGRGWLANTAVERALTRKESLHYIYGRRQLKNMLQRGEGLFWRRTKNRGELRIRLVARAKVVSRLLGTRLRGREVTFPLTHLLGSGRGRQATVNAALYTAVHAGQIGREEKSGPISRDKLREVSGCSKYRQRRYEKRMGIAVTRHIQILGRYSDYGLNRIRLHQGLPAYKHTDYHGKINRHRRGTAYIARRLPNSYRTPNTFSVIRSCRQRSINRQLAGLCLMGSEGSGRDEYVRLFYENGMSAVRAFNRNPQTTAFCPLSTGTSTELWRSIV